MVVKQFILTGALAIARNQARKRNLKRTNVLKRRNKCREELFLFGKDTERNKGLSAKVWKPDMEKRNYNLQR